jgi:hypothetical protein
MTRRVGAGLVSVVLAALLSGCSNDSADPSTSAASASSAAPPTPSVAAVSTTSSTTAVLPTSDTVTAASSDGSSPPPWPSTLSADEVAAAQSAITSYRSYWRTMDRAVAQPGDDWTDEISMYAKGPAKAGALETLSDLAAGNYRVVGSTGSTPQVIKVSPGNVEIVDCVDKTATDYLDSNGGSVKAPDQAGSYFRHPSNVQMVRLQDGRWAVSFTTDDWSGTC